MTLEFFAYTDESGNSGDNLFDKGQPSFWTGTLLAQSDLDKTASDDLNRIADKLGVAELHATELNFIKLESIAEELGSLLIFHDLMFVITRIEKEHVAALKFVDTILDNGNNPAVSPLHYGIRALRLSLARFIVDQLSPRSLQDFWKAYKTRDLKLFQRILERMRWNVINKMSDRRAQELLFDAIVWAYSNPEKVLDNKRSKFDSPNVIAIGLITNGIQSMLSDKDGRVTRFLHDEQNQFASTIKKAYDIVGKHFVGTEMTSFMTDINKTEILSSPIDFLTTGKASVGLQIVDIILWLTKRRLEKPWDGFPKLDSLMKIIEERSYLSQLTREQLDKDVASYLQKVASTPLSGEDLRRGMDLMGLVEENRVGIMKGR
jgi:hypothetical protein